MATELYYYCDFIPMRADLWYRVDWSITTGDSAGKQVHRSPVVQYITEDQFRFSTKLTEHHLRGQGVFKLGFTVSMVNVIL